MLSARFENFPLLRLSHVPEVFTKVIPILNEDEMPDLLSKYAELRPESADSDFSLRRTHLLEVILLLADLNSNKFSSFAECLSNFCQRYFVPFTSQQDKIELTLTQFRTAHVWTHQVNGLFAANMQGLQAVYD